MTEQDMGDHRIRVVGPLDPSSAAALDHVLLGYDYLDRHDVDGYLSLVESDVITYLPPDRIFRGREALGEQLLCGIEALRIQQVVVVRPRVLVVTGELREVPEDDAGGVVDTIVAGRAGLIRSSCRVRVS